MTIPPYAFAPFPRNRTLALFASIALLAHGVLIFGMAGLSPLAAMPRAAAERGISIDLVPAGAAQAAVTPSESNPETQPGLDHFPIENTERETAPAASGESAHPKDAGETALRNDTHETALHSDTPEAAPQSQAASAAKPGKTPAASSQKPSASPQKPAASSQRLTAQAASSLEEKDAPATATTPEPLDSAFNPKPIYPDLARRRGQEGLVQLRASVDDKGKLQELVVQKSSGYPLLDQAATGAVIKWRFRPGQHLGKAVSGIVLIPVEFRLSSPAAGKYQ